MGKKCWAFALALLLALTLAACGGQTEEQSENATSENEDSANAAQESHTMTMQEMADYFAEICEQSFGHANATASDDLITVNIWIENLSSMVSSMRAGTFDIENWNTLKASFLKTVNACQEVLEADKYEDVHFAFNVLDDEDFDKQLLSYYDSEIVYDVLPD